MTNRTEFILLIQDEMLKHGLDDSEMLTIMTKASKVDDSLIKCFLDDINEGTQQVTIGYTLAGVPTVVMSLVHGR